MDETKIKLDVLLNPLKEKDNYKLEYTKDEIEKLNKISKEKEDFKLQKNHFYYKEKILYNSLPNEYFQKLDLDSTNLIYYKNYFRNKTDFNFQNFKKLIDMRKRYLNYIEKKDKEKEEKKKDSEIPKKEIKNEINKKENKEKEKEKEIKNEGIYILINDLKEMFENYDNENKEDILIYYSVMDRIFNNIFNELEIFNENKENYKLLSNYEIKLSESIDSFESKILSKTNDKKVIDILFKFQKLSLIINSCNIFLKILRLMKKRNILFDNYNMIYTKFFKFNLIKTFKNNESSELGEILKLDRDITHLDFFIEEKYIYFCYIKEKKINLIKYDIEKKEKIIDKTLENSDDLCILNNKNDNKINLLLYIGPLFELLIINKTDLLLEKKIKIELPEKNLKLTQIMNSLNYFYIISEKKIYSLNLLEKDYTFKLILENDKTISTNKSYYFLFDNYIILNNSSFIDLHKKKLIKFEDTSIYEEGRQYFESNDNKIYNLFINRNKKALQLNKTNFLMNNYDMFEKLDEKIDNSFNNLKNNFMYNNNNNNNEEKNIDDLFKYYIEYNNDLDLILNLEENKNEKYKYKIDEKLSEDYYNYIYLSIIKFYYYSSELDHKLKINITNDIMLDNIKEIVTESNNYILLYLYTRILIKYKDSKKINEEEIEKQLKMIIELCKEFPKDNISPYYFYILRDIYKYKPEYINSLKLSENLLINEEKISFNNIIYYFSLISLNNNNNFEKLLKKFLEIEKVILFEDKTYDKNIYNEVCNKFLNYFSDINIYRFNENNFFEKFEKLFDILINNSIINELSQFIISSQKWLNIKKDTNYQFLITNILDKKISLLNDTKNSLACKILFLLINIIIYKIDNISKKNKKNALNIIKLLLKICYVLNKFEENEKKENDFLSEQIIIINSENLEKNFNLNININKKENNPFNKLYMEYDIESNYDLIIEIGNHYLINQKPIDLNEIEFTLKDDKKNIIKDNEKNIKEYKQFALKISNYKNEESISNILTDIRKCIIFCIIQLNLEGNIKKPKNILDKEEIQAKEIEKKLKDKKIKEILSNEFFNNISILKNEGIIIESSDKYLDFDYKDIINDDKGKNIITDYKILSKEINSLFKEEDNVEENSININLSLKSFNKMILSNESFKNLMDLIHKEFIKKNIWGSMSDSLLRNIIMSCFSIIISDFNLIKDFEELVKLNKDNKLSQENDKLKLFISIYTKINNIKKIFSQKKTEFSLINKNNNNEDELIDKYIKDINLKLNFIINNKVAKKKKNDINKIDNNILFLLDFITNKTINLNIIVDKLEELNEKVRNKEMALNSMNKMLYMSEKTQDIIDIINGINLIIKNGKNKLRDIDKDSKGADYSLIINYKKQIYLFILQLIKKIEKDTKKNNILYYLTIIQSLFWLFKPYDYPFLNISKFYEILLSPKNIIYELLQDINTENINNENNNILYISKITLIKKIYELFKFMAFISVEQLNNYELIDENHNDIPLIKYIFDFIFDIFNKYIEHKNDEEKLNILLLIFYRCIINKKTEERVSKILQKYYDNIFTILFNIFLYSSMKNKIITLKIIDILLINNSSYLNDSHIKKNIENIITLFKQKNIDLYNLITSKKVAHIDNILVELLFDLILLLQQNIENSIKYLNCTENNLSLSFMIIKILQKKLKKNDNSEITKEIIKFIELNFNNKKYITIILQILGVELNYEYIGSEIEIIENKEKGIILGYFNNIINEQQKNDDSYYKYINYSNGINLCCINKEDISYSDYYKNPDFTLELINKNNIIKNINNKLILSFEQNEKIYKELLKNINNYETKEIYLILRYIKILLLQEKIKLNEDIISFLLKNSLDEEVLKFECKIINMENLEKILSFKICEINKNILEDIEEKKDDLEEKDINTKTEGIIIDPESADIFIEKKCLLYRFGEEHKFGFNITYKKILNYDLFTENNKFLKIFNSEKNCKAYKENCVLLTKDILQLEKISPNIKYIIIPDMNENDLKKIKIATTPILILETFDYKNIYENTFEGQPFEEAENLFLKSLQTDASILIEIPIEKIAEFADNQRDILLEILNVNPKYEIGNINNDDDNDNLSDSISDDKNENDFDLNINEKVKIFCDKKLEDIDINLIYKKLISQISRRILIISKIIHKIKIEPKILKNIIKLLNYESLTIENKNYEIHQIIKNFVLQTSSDNEYDIIKEFIDLKFLEDKNILIDDNKAKDIKTENELLKLENLNNNILLINMFFLTENIKNSEKNEILNQTFLFEYINKLIKQDIHIVISYVLKIFKHIEKNIDEYVFIIIKNKELFNNKQFEDIFNYCENLIKDELYNNKKEKDNQFNEDTYEKIELIFCLFNIECILKYKHGINLEINYFKNIDNSSLLDIHVILSILINLNEENKIIPDINYYNFIKLCYQKGLYKYLIDEDKFAKPLKTFKFNYYDKTFNSNFVTNYQNIISDELLKNINNIYLMLKSYDDTIINPENCVFIYESEKCSNLQDYIKIYDRINDKKILLISPNFTISYPYKNFNCNLYGSGSNEKNSLGIQNNSGAKHYSTPQKCVGLEDCKNIIDFKFGYFHTFVQTADEDLYTCGTDDGSSFKFKSEFPYFNKQTYFYSLSKENSGIKLIAANNYNSSILVTKNNKLFCCGRNSAYCLGNEPEEGKEISKPILMREFLPLIKELKYPYIVKEIACGYKSTLFLLEDGYAFTCGSQDYRQCGSKENVPFYDDYFPLYPPRGTLFNHVVAGEEFFLLLVEEINEKGHNKLYSLGQNEFGRSGTGELNNNYTLQKLETVEDKDFMVISSRNENAAVISTEGILYTFGNNSTYALGLGDKANRSIPTKVSFLEEDYICCNVGISQNHMAIIARNKKTGKRCLFTCGDNQYKALCNCIDDKNKYDFPNKVSFFEENKKDEEPISSSLSRFQTYIMTIKCDLKDNLNKKLKDFKCIKCSKDIKDCLFFDFELKNNCINYYCKECAESNNKNIFYVINTVNDDTKQNLELLLKNENIFKDLNIIFEPNKDNKKYNCLNCKEEIKNNIYQCYSDEKIILCSKCYISKCPLIKYPQIFISYDYNICPVKDTKKCEIDKLIYLNNITKTDKPYLELELYANYKKEYIIKELYNNKEIKDLYNKYWNFIDNKILIEMRKLKEFYEDNKFDYLIKKENKKEEEKKEDKIEIKTETKEDRMKNMENKNFEYLANIAGKSNKYLIYEIVQKLLELRNKNNIKNADFNNLDLYIKYPKLFSFAFSLSNYINLGILKILSLSIKFSFGNNLFKKVIESSLKFITSEERKEIFIQNIEKERKEVNFEDKEITLSRIKADVFYKKNILDKEYKYTVFSQLFKETRSYPKDNYLCCKNNRLFKIRLLGEGATDFSGVFNEIISIISFELQSEYLDLLIKTPNNKNEIGSFRDRYIPNPKAKGNIKKDLFYFLGNLMLYSICSGNVLDLNLHPIFYKKLLNNEVDFSEIETLDKLSYKFIISLENIKDKNEFKEKYNDLFFVVHSSSDNSLIELVDNGQYKKVTYENLNEYIKLYKEFLLTEYDSQIAIIRSGIFDNLLKKNNINYSSLLTPQDLEEFITGEPKLNIQLLRQRTTYEPYEPNLELFQNFWKAIESFTEKEKSLYLKFVSGRTKLPNPRNINFIHKIQKDNRINPDKFLPKSTTCYFTLSLPTYTSYEVLREKLLYAIHNCSSIDADFVPDEIDDPFADE